jgi:hypothetical protein
MNLGPDKLTTNMQDPIDHIELNRATGSNLFTRNHT